MGRPKKLVANKTVSSLIPTSDIKETIIVDLKYQINMLTNENLLLRDENNRLKASQTNIAENYKAVTDLTLEVGELKKKLFQARKRAGAAESGWLS